MCVFFSVCQIVTVHVHTGMFVEATLTVFEPCGYISCTLSSCKNFVAAFLCLLLCPKAHCMYIYNVCVHDLSAFVSFFMLDLHVHVQYYNSLIQCRTSLLHVHVYTFLCIYMRILVLCHSSC